MCKSEIFAKIIALVSKGTEIPTELIVSDNRVTEIGYIQQISIGHEGISGSIRLSFQQETL